MKYDFARNYQKFIGPARTASAGGPWAQPGKLSGRDPGPTRKGSAGGPTRKDFDKDILSNYRRPQTGDRSEGSTRNTQGTYWEYMRNILRTYDEHFRNMYIYIYIYICRTVLSLTFEVCGV